jgi:hypothetical protein
MQTAQMYCAVSSTTELVAFHHIEQGLTASWGS